MLLQNPELIPESVYTSTSTSVLKGMLIASDLRGSADRLRDLKLGIEEHILNSIVSIQILPAPLLAASEFLESP